MSKKEPNNGEKAVAGSKTQEAFDQFIEQLLKRFPKIKLSKNVYYGAKGKDPHQFKIKDQIEFPDQKLYILADVASSITTDREKGKDFTIENVKKILTNRRITSEAYLVVPDNYNPKKLKSTQKLKTDIESKHIVTYFDGLMSATEFGNFLERKATAAISQGIKSNLIGQYGEKVLVEAFNNHDNLQLWNHPEDYLTKSTTYSLFKAVLNKMCPDIGKITYSKAYRGEKGAKDPISKELKHVKGSNGYPKTDVLIQLRNNQNKKYKLTVSVKSPTSGKRSGRVSAHQGHAEALINDLKASLPKDSIFQNQSMFDKLSKALLNFQKAGSKSAMDPECRTFLNENLSDLNKWLIDYFIFGINNSNLNSDQIASYLLIFNPVNGYCKVMTVKETEDSMLNGRMATFNTPFGWTYPSKKRGIEYQIKAPFKLE